MIPVLAGLLAASAWAFANVGSTRAAHHIGTVSTVALTTAVGLIVVGPFALATPLPPLSDRDLVALACSGGGGVLGLLLAYRAFRIGRVAVVAPVLSAQGAVAALLSVMAGERLAPLAAVMLVVVGAGVAVVALGSRRSEVAAEGGVAAVGSAELAADGPSGSAPSPVIAAERDDRTSVGGATPKVVAFAAIGALGFGTGLFGTGLLAGGLPLAWVALPSRFVGGALLLALLAVTGRLRFDRRALPWVVLVGLADVGGVFVFAVGAQEAAATASVFASQVAVVSTIGAALLLRERPTRVQLAGLAIVAVGTAVLALARG